MNVNDILIKTPNPMVRPHVVPKKNKKKIEEWLKISHGVSVFISYPYDKRCPMEVRPVIEAVETEEYPDTAIYTSSGVLRNDSGELIVTQPAVRWKRIGFDKIKMVLIDSVCLGDDSIEQILERDFVWI